MSAPDFVPAGAVADKVYESPPQTTRHWFADRPGDPAAGSAQPTGPALGYQGPGQGYVLKLAKRLVDDLVLAPGEHEADAIAGACSVALRRASMFGRAPITDDLRVALTVFGYLDSAPDDLVAFRRGMFDEVHHHMIHYRSALDIADVVPEATLRLSLAEVKAGHDADWRGALGLEG